MTPHNIHSHSKLTNNHKLAPTFLLMAIRQQFVFPDLQHPGPISRIQMGYKVLPPLLKMSACCKKIWKIASRGDAKKKRKYTNWITKCQKPFGKFYRAKPTTRKEIFWLALLRFLVGLINLFLLWQWILFCVLFFWKQLLDSTPSEIRSFGAKFSVITNSMLILKKLLIQFKQSATYIN